MYGHQPLPRALMMCKAGFVQLVAVHIEGLPKYQVIICFL